MWQVSEWQNVDQNVVYFDAHRFMEGELKHPKIPAIAGIFLQGE